MFRIIELSFEKNIKVLTELELAHSWEGTVDLSYLLQLPQLLIYRSSRLHLAAFIHSLSTCAAALLKRGFRANRGTEMQPPRLSCVGVEQCC